MTAAEGSAPPLNFPPPDAAPFSVVWQAQSPFGPCVGVAIPSDARTFELPAALAPEERAFAAASSPARARTFVAGRVALRAAFAAASLPAPPAVLTGAQGQPLLPASAWGSISHKHNLAVAVAAPAEGRGGLGIDLEAAAPGAVDIAKRVLLPDELERLHTLPPEARARQTRMAFCVKEALYKAVHPLVDRFFGFHEGRVALPFDAAGQSFLAVHAEAFPAGMSEKTATTAHLLVSAGCLLAVVRARGNALGLVETRT